MVIISRISFFKITSNFTCKGEKCFSSHNILFQLACFWFDLSMHVWYFYVNFHFRTAFEFIVALGLLMWLILRGLLVIDHEKFIYCHIKPYYYHCAGHPQKFYFVMCLAAIVMVFLYLFCCIYSIFWMFIPQFGSLSGAMQKIKKEYLKTRSTTDLSDR